MNSARRTLLMLFTSGLFLDGCSTSPDGGKATTLELAGTFNVPGGVTYSLKDDAVSCKSTTVLVQDLMAKGYDLQNRTVTIPANRSVIVEALYVQTQPRGTCQVSVEFMPADGGTYLIFLDQVGLLFGPRCNVFLKEYVPHTKTVVDKTFKKVCG